VQVAGAIAHFRLQETLDKLGPPGQWHCDPIAGTLTLRGHTFAAEMLGTYGRTEWLWAWANSFQNLPEDKTTISREARDELGIPVLETPFVDLEGIGGPHQIAMQVIGYGLGAGYYVCAFPESYAVYALLDGEVRPEWPKIYELQRALQAVMMDGLQDGVMAIMQAARYLGVSTEPTAKALTVYDGDDRLVVHLEGQSITKIDASVKL
jgi:hypothetical protein